MGLTLTNLNKYTLRAEDGSHGAPTLVTGTYEFDSSYLTGGELLTAALLGVTRIRSVVAGPASNGTEAVVVRWVVGNGTTTDALQAFWGGGAVSSELDEITSTDNVSGFKGTFQAVCINE